MRWTRTGCVATLVAVKLANASHDSKGARILGRAGSISGEEPLPGIMLDSVEVAYPKITPPPVYRRKFGLSRRADVYSEAKLPKRDTSCPVSYQLCPQSLNGGCCPLDRVCGADSCYATISATNTAGSACGVAGYVACGSDNGGEISSKFLGNSTDKLGGCCPSNYMCGRSGCTLLAGVANTETCGPNSYLCPASYNYGCCQNGLACGLNNCYATAVQTISVNIPFTTTEAGSAQVMTSTIIATSSPTIPPGIVTSGDSAVVVKASGDPMAQTTKTPATGTSDSAAGLSKGAIGGIIGGAIALLMVIIIVASIVIRSLNNVKKVIESGASGSRSRKSHLKPDIEVDALSIDPLMMGSSTAPKKPRHRASSFGNGRVSYELQSTSPSSLHKSSPQSPYSPAGKTHTAVTSEGSSTGGYRQPSLDSSQSGYFDIPPQPDLRDQNIRFGHVPPMQPLTGMHVPFSPVAQIKHGRQWSEDSAQSDQSFASRGSSVEQELLPDGPRSGVQRAIQGIGIGRILSRNKKAKSRSPGPRRQSDPPVILTGGPTARPEWTVNPAGLGHITEAGESRLDIQDIRHFGMVSPQVDARMQASPRIVIEHVGDE